MKQIRISLLSAFVLAALLLASFAWVETPAVYAQEASTTALQLDVTVELADGETITVPVQLTQDDLFALMEQAPISTVVAAAARLMGSEVQTITVGVPAVFTPTMAALHIVSSLPAMTASETMTMTETMTETEAMTETETMTETPAAPVTTTLAITVPSAPAIDLVPAAISNANLRSAPSTDADIVGQATAGQALMLQARNVDGSWYQLVDGSWVAAFLVENTPQDLPVVIDGELFSGETVPATVTSQALVLRANPDADADSLGSYAQGTVVAVLGRSASGNWLEIAAPDGKRGWMSAAFLELSAPLDAMPETSSAPPVSLLGQVVDQIGAGIGDVVVTALPPAGGVAQSVETTTDANGMFTLEFAAGSEGIWTVQVSEVGCDSRIVNESCQLFGYYAAIPAVDVNMAALEPVTLAYTEATSFIAGEVVDDKGNPLKGGIRVLGERQDGARTSGETSSAGAFVLPAAAGVWTVGAEGGSALEVDVPEKSAPEPIELTLK